MKVYQSNEIKNIALIGSKGSGKTTLAEAMLYECGVIKRRGSIDAQNTVSDYFPVEKEYGYSVFSTVFYAEFNDKKLNVIDCPGSDDFVGGAITALTVTDTGVIVVDSQYGVEVGTQNIFRYAEKLEKPVIFAMNQLDGEKADFDNSMEQLREHFGNKVTVIQYPINAGPSFNAMIDVLLMKMYKWKPEGGVPEISDIPAEEMDKATELHQKLVEAAAENDESLMEKFFDQGKLTEDEMREGIRKGILRSGLHRDLIADLIVSGYQKLAVDQALSRLLGQTALCDRDLVDLLCQGLDVEHQRRVSPYGEDVGRVLAFRRRDPLHLPDAVQILPRKSHGGQDADIHEIGLVGHFIHGKAHIRLR